MTVGAGAGSVETGTAAAGEAASSMATADFMIETGSVEAASSMATEGSTAAAMGTDS
jgi:hypothetical protein